MIFSPEPIFSLFETGNMVTAQGPVLLIRIEPESKCSNLHTCAQIKKPPPCFLHLSSQSPVPAPTTFSPELTRQDAKNVYQRS